MIKVFEKIKLKLWSLVYSPIFNYKYWKIRSQRELFNILNSQETVEYIIKNHCSVSRYGDGELAMIYHYLNNGTKDNFYIKAFQDYDKNLAKALYKILVNPIKCHKVAIPFGIKSVSDYIGTERIFWQRFVILDIDRFSRLFNKNELYLNAAFTRFYLNHKKYNIEKYISDLKKIWDNRHICIIEGEKSRLGVGNDLFANAKNISRILCPATNAFSSHDAIISAVRENKKYELYLIALGHTATVLAYELAEQNYWAIDIGHIDIEYEWYLLKAKSKVAIQNKYVNEIPEGRICSDCNDETYQSQIIVKLL